MHTKLRTINKFIDKVSSCCFNFIYLVVLVAGGYTNGQGSYADVEVYSPKGTCQLRVRNDVNFLKIFNYYYIACI